MMLVKNYADKSLIHGIGVFAGEDIPKGAVIWRFDNLIDKVLSQKDLDLLPPVVQEYVRFYAYETDGKYILGGDNGIYFNHSGEPNTLGLESTDGYGVTIAARLIKKGEELTGDYNEFDDRFDERQAEEDFV